MKSSKKSRTEWMDLVRSWEGSGQSQGSFCADREVNLATFSYWRGQYLRERVGEHPGEVAGPRGFVALRSGEEAGLVKLRLGSLEVSFWAEADFVAEVLVKLAGRC